MLTSACSKIFQFRGIAKYNSIFQIKADNWKKQVETGTWADAHTVCSLYVPKFKCTHTTTLLFLKERS